ncbi:MAG: glycosyltransferase [Planctomycetota bacterium]|nr:MAG: glycosyltransferase [Planctomycetota bacterium]
MVGNNPRTLLISPFFGIELPTGRYSYSMDITREWLRRGRRVAVLCARQARLSGELDGYVDEGRLILYPVISPEQIRFTHHPHGGLQQLSARIINEFDPEIIHVHGVHGCLSVIRTAVNSSVPVILTATDFGLLCFNFHLYDDTNVPCEGPVSSELCASCVGKTISSCTHWLGSILPDKVSRRLWSRMAALDQIKQASQLHTDMRYILRLVDAFIVPSPIMADRLCAFGVPDRRIEEILYGVSAESMFRTKKIPSEFLRLAYIGGTEPIDGFDVLARAVESLPDALPLEISAIGKEALRKALGRYPPHIRRYIRYCEQASGCLPAEKYARIDAVLVPSLWHENSPLVILESLANGTPVFASDQAGIRHLVIHEHTGWLLEPGIPTDWTRAFIRAVQRPALIRRMHNNTDFTRTTADFVNEAEALELDLMRTFVGGMEENGKYLPYEPVLDSSMGLP